jgi:hypothetical protein
MVGGAAGTDAEKQAWIAKYATRGPSLALSAPGTQTANLVHHQCELLVQNGAVVDLQ